MLCKAASRLPHGGRGLKFGKVLAAGRADAGRLPHGGRGLKCYGFFDVVQGDRRLPHGGRGLKCDIQSVNDKLPLVVSRTGDVG